jgi:hypothetical protein
MTTRTWVLVAITGVVVALMVRDVVRSLGGR